MSYFYGSVITNVILKYCILIFADTSAFGYVYRVGNVIPQLTFAQYGGHLKLCSYIKSYSPTLLLCQDATAVRTT